MNTLRRNATLATVACRARKLATKALHHWRTTNMVHTGHADAARSDDAFQHFSELNELADHLERLAGLPITVSQ